MKLYDQRIPAGRAIFSLFILFALASPAGAQGDRAFQGDGARAVASFVDQNALLEDTIKNIGVNVKAPESLIAYLEQIQQLKPGYKFIINWVGPGPADPAIKQLFADHVESGVEVNFYEFETEDLEKQLRVQNQAIGHETDEDIARLTDGSVDPAQLREISKSENRKIFDHFRRWQEKTADFTRQARRRMQSPLSNKSRTEQLDLAGHGLGLAKVAGLVGFWFFSGEPTGEMDMQTMAVAAAASGSGAYLAWLFTRYGPEWLEYRQNFKIVRTKVKVQWFSLMSWLRGAVAVGSNAFLRVPGGQKVARWFNQTRWTKYLVIDAAVRGGLGVYFRLLAFVKGGGMVDPPWSPKFWGEMASAHQDLLYSSAAESSLQQLYEKGAISESVRWVGVQAWGFCIYSIQIVTDFGFKSFLWGRATKGIALAIMIPTKIGTIVAGSIINEPLSARGKHFANVIPKVDPKQVRVTVVSAEYSERDRTTLAALNQLDNAIEANRDGQVDLQALADLVETMPEDPIKLGAVQKVARAFYKFSERWLLSPLRQPFYGSCPGSFVKGAD